MIICTFEDGGTGKLRHAVVDALLIKDGKILLVKRAKKLTQGGKWGVVGGFIERDEFPTQTVSREVFEETGYRVKKADFFTIVDNPQRVNDERQNIAFVFVCEAGEKEGEPDNESSEQKWFDLENLPKEEEFAFDHLQVINLYLKHKNDTFPKLFSY